MFRSLVLTKGHLATVDQSALLHVIGAPCHLPPPPPPPTLQKWIQWYIVIYAPFMFCERQHFYCVWVNIDHLLLTGPWTPFLHSKLAKRSMLHNSKLEVTVQQWLCIFVLHSLPFPHFPFSPFSMLSFLFGREEQTVWKPLLVWWMSASVYFAIS